MRIRWSVPDTMRMAVVVAGHSSRARQSGLGARRLTYGESGFSGMRYKKAGMSQMCQLARTGGGVTEQGLFGLTEGQETAPCS